MDSYTITCKFDNVRERDMDLLFLEAFATDPGFTNLLVEETKKYRGKDFSVVDIELSRTDSELGESDITVKLDFDGVLCGFLIEDKIDAPAMPDQHLRYVARGEKGIISGEYQDYAVFILCPKRYRENKDESAEARKYEHFVSYEKIRDYFEKTESPINKVRVQQLNQAINEAKVINKTILNEAANAYNIQYHEYQRKHYPNLNLRTSDSSNGYWQHYTTRYGSAYVYHKTQEGYVDLTFPGTAPKLLFLEKMADWLRKHGIEAVQAEKTGKSGALRLRVPPLNITEPFENTKEEDLRKCLDVVQNLTDYANMLADAKLLT